jgi:UPF0716 family protein affecting phage T7 exclusion
LVLIKPGLVTDLVGLALIGVTVASQLMLRAPATDTATIKEL